MFAHRFLLLASLNLAVIAIPLVPLGCKPAAIPKPPPPRFPAKNSTYHPFGARASSTQAKTNPPGTMYIPPNVVNSTKSNGFQTPRNSAPPAQQGRSRESQRESLEAKLLGDFIQGLADVFQPGGDPLFLPNRPSQPPRILGLPPRSTQQPGDDQIDRVINLILQEMEVALAEGRAYAGNGPLVRKLGIISNNGIRQFGDGKSYLVATVKESHNPSLLPGDLIVAVNGFLLAPGWDVTAILNRVDAPLQPSVDVIRGAQMFQVRPEVYFDVPTQEEIAQRRVLNAIERLQFLELEIRGAIPNPAWR